MNSRYRRSPVVKAGSLAQLGELMQSKQTSPSVVGAASNTYGISQDDDDLSCVWKVMSDGRGRTPTELIAALAPFPDLVHPDDVEGLLRILVTNGFAHQQANRNDECIYTLKKGVTISMLGNTGRQASKLRGPQSDLKGLPLEGSINLSEGIMVCLWKVMSDFKARTQEQIFDILVAYGINREVAKDAFIRAKVNQKWFDWHGVDKNNTPHRLKKHIKMPKIENVDPATLRQKMSPGAIRLPTPAAAPLTAYAPQGGPKGPHHFFTDANQPRIEMNTDYSFHPAPPLTTQEAVVPSAPVKHYQIYPGDAMDVMIWKVMSDHQPYTASEVGLLLKEFGHNPATVKSRISRIFLHDGHWFTREKTRNKVSGAISEYVYVLNDNVPMPPGEVKPPEAQPPLPPAQTTLPLQQSPATDNKEEEMKQHTSSTTPYANGVGTAMGTAMKQAQNQATATPQANTHQPAQNDDDRQFRLSDLPDSNLLKFQVQIRNTPYSFAQVEVLTRELLANGFGQGKRRNMPNGLLQASYRVGNASFTGDEMEDLTEQLLKVGFGDNE